MTASRTDCPKLLSLAVHELRTPVNVATGYLRMLVQFHGQALTEEQRKFVTEAAHSCGKLGELLADLSALSNLLSGDLPLKREEVPLFSLAAEVAASLTDGQERGIRIEVRGAGQAAMAHGDRTWLQSALRSVLASVVREHVQAGTVTVECRAPAEGRPRRAVVAIGDEAACSMLASLAPARWAPFDPWRGGSGFALPIAAGIVAAHHGQIGALPGAKRHAAVAIALPVTA
jgi:signal transduction histidine kinase